MQTQMFYTLGKKLGLTKNDIDQALKNVLFSDEHPTLSLGPPFYHGGSRYGTFSIQIFLKNEKK
jgi:hypothetical protein